MNEENNMMTSSPNMEPAKRKSPRTPGQKFLFGLNIFLLLAIVAFTAILIIGSIMKKNGRVSKDASIFDGFMAFVNGTDEKANETTKVVDNETSGSATTVKPDPDKISGIGPSSNVKVPEVPDVNAIIDSINDKINKYDNTEGTDNGNNDNTDGTPVDEIPTGEYLGVKVLSLGKYVGVEAKINSRTVSEDEIDQEIINFADEFAVRNDITKGKVQEYDDVVFSCVGYVDGELYEGCTLNEYELVVGSGSMIAGFEESMIGKKIGKTYSVDLVFPDDYYEDLAGKPVTFEITIHSKVEYDYPELNDELIAANTDCATIDEYREVIRAELQEDIDNEATETAKSEVIEKIIESCTFSDTIDAEIEEDYENSLAYYDESFQSNYGADAATIYEMYFGMSADEYRDMVHAESEQYVKYYYVVRAIAEAEKFDVSDEEYEAKFKEVFFDQYGFTSKEEVFDIISEEEADYYVKDPIIQEKVETLIFENVIYTK